MHPELQHYLDELRKLKRFRLWRYPQRRLMLSDLLRGPARHHEDDYGTHLRQTLAWIKQARAQGGWGVSSGWGFDGGWQPADPAVSAELVETLLVVSPLAVQPGLAVMAEELLAGLLARQEADGGFVSETGQTLSPLELGCVLRGLLAGTASRQAEACREGARRLARHLAGLQRDDGAWLGEDGEGRAHFVMAAWPLAALGRMDGDDALLESARRGLAWTLARQTACGWFENNATEPDGLPTSAEIVRTLRGVLETAELLKDEQAFSAAELGARELLERRRRDGAFDAVFDDDWDSCTRAVCVPAVAQAAVLWLRLTQLGRGRGWRDATTATLSYIKRTQRLGVRELAQLRGAVPGAAPLWETCGRFVFPAEAAKYFVDALVIDRTNTVIPPGPVTAPLSGDSE